MPRGVAAVDRALQQVRGFTVPILLPFFFAAVGLEVVVGNWDGALVVWLLLAAILTVAFGGKLAGAYLGARLAGLPARSALTTIGPSYILT